MAALRLASACRAALRPALASASAPMRQRGIATTSVCMKTELPLPDNLEHAVGIEKFEKLAHLAGIDDPWDIKPFQVGAGTKDSPTIVPSMYNRRLIGHLCEEDQTYLTYFYVYKGVPKRCKCGHWFKVTDAEPYHY